MHDKKEQLNVFFVNGGRCKGGGRGVDKVSPYPYPPSNSHTRTRPAPGRVQVSIPVPALPGENLNPYPPHLPNNHVFIYFVDNFLK